jgi:uncharacterized membrane protein YjdF
VGAAWRKTVIATAPVTIVVTSSTLAATRRLTLTMEILPTSVHVKVLVLNNRLRHHLTKLCNDLTS